MRALIVDDDPLLLQGIRMVLGWAHPTWRTEFSQSGEDALRLVAEAADDAYDVVLSDLRMPGLSGEALLQRVRETSPATVRVLFSGALEISQVIGLATTANRIIRKPAKFDLIEAMLTAVGELVAGCEPTERQCICSELDLVDLALRYHDAPSASAGANPWRYALGAQVIATGVTDPASDRLGFPERTVSIEVLQRARGRVAPSKLYAPVDAERLDAVGRRAQLSMEIASELTKGDRDSNGAVTDDTRAAHAAAFAWLMAISLPHDTPGGKLLRLSAAALAVRGIDPAVVSTMRAASLLLEAPADALVSESSPPAIAVAVGVALADAALPPDVTMMWQQRAKEAMAHEHIAAHLAEWFSQWHATSPRGVTA